MFAVRGKMSSLRPGQTVTLGFYLPDELMTRAGWRAEPSGKFLHWSSEHSGGRVRLTYSYYETRASPEGTLDFEYTGRVGVRLPVEVGPAHGYADGSYFIAGLDYLLPRIESGNRRKLKPASYDVRVVGGKYSVNFGLSRLHGQMMPEGRYCALLVAGDFECRRFSSALGQLDVCAPGGWPRAAVDSSASDVARRLFAFLHPRSGVRTVLAVPSRPLGAVSCSPCGDVIAADWLPMTPERALRLAEELAHSLLRERAAWLSHRDNHWLVYSLPRYLALNVAAEYLSGYTLARALDEASTRTASAQSRGHGISLINISSESPTIREYVAAENGLAALGALEEMLERRGSSLKDLLKRHFSGPAGRSLLSSLTATVGRGAAIAFWTSHVAGAGAPSKTSGTSYEIMRSGPGDGLNRTPGTREVPIRVTAGLNGQLFSGGCPANPGLGGASGRTFAVRNRPEGTLAIELGDFLPRA